MWFLPLMPLLRQPCFSRELELDLSKTQLASKLGTISETLSRTLAKMKAKGIIGVKKNKILILNREALEELSSSLKI